MSDDDDDLLNTSFSFHKKRLSSNKFAVQDEQPSRKRDLKELLSDLGDREGLLASDDFWDRFHRPTQEEVQLELEQKEREENESDESDDDDDKEENDQWNCQLSLSERKLELEPDELFGRILDEIPINYKIGKLQDLIHLLPSSLAEDIILAADFPDQLRTELYQVILECVTSTNDKTLLSSLENFAFGLLKSSGVSLRNGEGQIRRLLSNICLDTSVSNKNTIGELKDFDDFESLTTFLRILEFDMNQNSTLLDETVVSKIFQVIAPLLFDPSLAKVHSQVASLLIVCANWLPVCLSEKFVNWIAPLNLSHKQTIKLLRVLAASPKGMLYWIPVLNNSLSKLLNYSPTDDLQFVNSLNSYLRTSSADPESRSLANLYKILRLASLRVLQTAIEDIPKADVVNLRESLTITKDSIPPQPRLFNIRSLDLIAFMTAHIEGYLRSKGIGVHKAGRIDHHFMQKL